ncbi:copper chaperone PCu(A)C [Streptomyces sp. HNM0663]|uniref:Copper chaperone PCu(A)C n=1 Tax=Streptomyces chengmaiensis TaxID=3040919 RepID=A0ABT6HJ31_9ACTN|nr:copper chaperone PCu(A)C [Streptomyces chengmaiensis]MDH2388351.1 copper chaperone PCu(A)C [Streptomyces chengmaiensis]
MTTASADGVGAPKSRALPPGSGPATAADADHPRSTGSSRGAGKGGPSERDSAPDPPNEESGARGGASLPSAAGPDADPAAGPGRGARVRSAAPGDSDAGRPTDPAAATGGVGPGDPDGGRPRPAGGSRRVAALAGAVGVPVGTCAVTLGLLTAYTSTGAAGQPPAEISVVRARVVQPIDSRDTIAYIDLRNTGGTDATLVSVEAPLTGTANLLSRDVIANDQGLMKAVPALRIPADEEKKARPSIADVMIEDPPSLTLGETVEFLLRFRDGSTVSARAVVVLPGS